MDSSPGTLAALWRWPVKSMAGERVNALRVDGRGAGGDRTHAVLYEHKGEWKPLTAREAPRLLAWQAAYPFNVNGGLDPARPPYAVVTAPDGHRYRWGDPRLRLALEDDLGRPVQLARDVEGIQDLPRTLLITPKPTLDALGEELGGRSTCAASAPTCTSTSTSRPGRSSPGRAASWPSRAAFGCASCTRASAARSPRAIPTRRSSGRLLRHLNAVHAQVFGINARVVTAGRIAAGEAVALQVPA